MSLWESFNNQRLKDIYEICKLCQYKLNNDKCLLTGGKKCDEMPGEERKKKSDKKEVK